MRFRFRTRGSFSRTRALLTRNKHGTMMSILRRYGDKGVELLSNATPVDTGLTSYSWYYQIEEQDGRTTLHFCNSNVQDGVPIAIILQYGHGTGTGGWVEGRDYINPAVRPIFESLADSLWKEVSVN